MNCKQFLLVFYLYTNLTKYGIDPLNNGLNYGFWVTSTQNSEIKKKFKRLSTYQFLNFVILIFSSKVMKNIDFVIKYTTHFKNANNSDTLLYKRIVTFNYTVYSYSIVWKITFRSELIETGCYISHQRGDDVFYQNWGSYQGCHYE